MLLALAIVTAVADAPSASVIEGSLRQLEFCRVSIDGCVDGNGKQIYPESEFKVSNVACESAAKPARVAGRTVKQSMRCRFNVEHKSMMDGEQIGQTRILPSSGLFDLIRYTGNAGKTGYFWRQRLGSN